MTNKTPLNRKRILVLTSTFPRWMGDSEPPFVFELCRHIQSDFDITVLAPHARGARREESMLGIRVIRYRYATDGLEALAYEGGILARLRAYPWLYFMVPFFLLGQLIGLIKLLRSEPFDAIHAHWIIPQGFIAHLACMISGKTIPILTTSHGGDLFALRSGLLKRIKRYVIAHSAHVTAVSPTMKDEIVALGAPPEKVSVMPMGVELESTFTPAATQAQNRERILFVGRLVEKKGVHILLQAFSKISNDHQNATLEIVGDGPLRTKLLELATTLKIAHRVNFRGKIANSELPDIYRSAGIFVMPSIEDRSGDQEGFGLVLIEAAGCNCACIASRLPAIISTATGLPQVRLVHPNDCNDLADALSDTLHELAIDKINRNMPEDIRNRYGWRSVANAYADILKGLMKQQHQER